MGVTTPVRTAVSEARQAYAGLAAKWTALRTGERAALNEKLKAAGLGPIEIEEANR
jgi:hypothetical protein